MEAATFWKLLGNITAMGSFIAAVPNDGASANLVGELQLGYDGGEKVLEKEKCHCHIHLYPEKLVTFVFCYRDVGYGQEPCLELLTLRNEAALRLYYRGNNATGKYRDFISKNAAHADLFQGAW